MKHWFLWSSLSTSDCFLQPLSMICLEVLPVPHRNHKNKSNYKQGPIATTFKYALYRNWWSERSRGCGCLKSDSHHLASKFYHGCHIRITNKIMSKRKRETKNNNWLVATTLVCSLYCNCWSKSTCGCCHHQCALSLHVMRKENQTKCCTTINDCGCIQATLQTHPKSQYTWQANKHACPWDAHCPRQCSHLSIGSTRIIRICEDASMIKLFQRKHQLFMLCNRVTLEGQEDKAKVIGHDHLDIGVFSSRPSCH